MMVECPKCGQKLRDDWFRCPRCRELVPNAPAEQPAEPPTSEQTRSPWLIPSVAGIAILAIAIVVASSRGGDDSVAKAAAVRPPPLSAPVANAEPVDQEVLARNESMELRRAGSVAYTNGDIDSALAQFQAAVEANPNDAEARNNLAQVLVRLKRSTEALAHLDEAVRLDEQKWAYRFNRARAYAELNRLPEAITEYRVAANLFPDDYATHFNLGVVFLRTKQYPEAVQSLERAVNLAPGEPSFLISLGTAYVGVEQPAKAKAAFQHFLEIAPDDPESPRVKALIEALDAAS
jgi:tetratricopeptide (TPR) repeat protein